jgi:hypothetical protein
MNKEDKSQDDNCTNYQEKIFELFDKNLSVNSDSTLSDHIKNCQNCQIYLQNLDILKNRMSDSPSKSLKPDSRIQQNIIAYNNIKKGLQSTKPNPFWDSIRDIFEYRVPVYQALSGVVVVFMLFLYISNSIVSPGKRTTMSEYSGEQKDITSSELYVLDTLSLNKPERGQNAKEDSVLISFLVPTM